MGMSRQMVASSLESNASSVFSSTRSLSLPFSSPECSMTPSKLPYWCKSFDAVLAPTPGMPGMLSALSPIIPRRSMTCSGSSTSNFSRISSGPQTSAGLPPRPGRNIRILSVTS